MTHSFIDGIIINSENLHEEDLVKLKKQNIPVVTVDRITSSNIASSISVNNRQGGRLATNYLFEVGCKNIGHLRGPKHISTANERFFGYTDTVKEYDWFSDNWIELVDFSVESGFLGMTRLLDNHPRIDGVFAANDLVAIGALKAAIERGVNVPDDLAIIGFDGIAISELTYPRITTIQQPIYRMGELAMEEILNFIKKPNTVPQHYELDVALVKRESTLRKPVLS